LQVIHDKEPIPTIKYPSETFMGNEIVLEASEGEIIVADHPSGTLHNISVLHNKLYASVKAESGVHTVFIRVKADQFDTWLAADFLVKIKPV
jgi:hypothetical protein